jgi:lipoyl(octanoyl) transferase
MSHVSHAPAPCRDLRVCRLGVLAYREAMELQGALCARRQADELPDVLLLLEHPPTYTRGRRSRPDELPLGESFYQAQGVEIHRTDRGGRVTYHGPGQLVGYAILRVRDVVAYVRTLERAIVAALADTGVAARSRAPEGPDFTGVWVQDRKIASIGVHCSRGVTTHGFAVNVDNDLEPFSWIVPCGLAGVRMTSIAAELSCASPGAEHRRQAAEGGSPLLQRFAQSVTAHLCEQLGCTPEHVGAQALGATRSGPGAAPCAQRVQARPAALAA